jgi:hypothetical protein
LRVWTSRVLAHTPPGRPTSRAFAALVATLGLIEGFFLLRPLIGPLPYFGPRTNTGYSYWYLVAVPFLPYAAALRACRAGRGIALPILFGVAIVLHLALVAAPASQSQDVYQSLLYGKMTLHGTNPYAVTPGSEDDPWSAWTLWDDTPSVYGPAWTVLSAAVVAISRENLAVAFLLLKGVSVLLGLLATWLLVLAHRSPTAAPGTRGAHGEGWVVLAFAYNPLVIFASGLGAHADVAVAAALAGALLAERRGRHRWTTLLLTLALLVKAYAVLALCAWLLVLARRRGLARSISHGILALLALVTAYIPFWEGTRSFEGLWAVGHLASNSLTGTLVRIGSGELGDASAAGASSVGRAVRWLAVLAILGAFAHLVHAPRIRPDLRAAATLLLGTYVLVTPWYLPWHLLGLLALAVLAPEDPISIAALVFSGTSLFVGFGGSVVGLALQAVVRYLPPIVLAYRYRHHRDRRDPTTNVLSPVL